MRIQNVDPRVVELRLGEKINEEFSFLDSDGQVVDIADLLEVSVNFTINDEESIEASVQGTEATVGFDEDSVSEEGLYTGYFEIEWNDDPSESEYDEYDNKNIIPGVTIAVEDPESRLSIEEIRNELWQIASEKEVYDGLEEFSDYLLIHAKFKALDVLNSSVATTKRERKIATVSADLLPKLREAAAGQAFLLRGKQLAGDFFPYQADGLSVEDQEQKMQLFIELGNQATADFKRHITHYHTIRAMSRHRILG